MSRWTDENYLAAYLHARAGHSNGQIARILGADSEQFLNWLDARPALQKALDTARAERGGVQESFKDWVFEKLPTHLQRLWTELDKVETGAPRERVDAILADEGENVRKHLFLHALPARLFNASQACKAVGISKQTLQRWIDQDPEYAELISEITWHKKNYFEESLVHACARGEASAIIFANRTLNRDRGYGDRTTIDVNVEQNVNVNLIDLTKLNLPTNVLMMIRDAIKAQNNATAQLPGPQRAAGALPASLGGPPPRVFDATSTPVPG